MTGSAFADTQAAIRSVEWSSFNKPTRVADALGLAASEFTYGPSRARAMADPDMGAWTYDYNALDELTGQTDAKLQTAAMTYDLLGRIETRSEPEGVTTWTYDSQLKTAAIGKLDRITRTGDDYVEDQFYDITTGKPTETVVSYEGRDYVNTLGYDHVGRPEILTWPAASDGSRLAAENEYNAYGYLKTVREYGGAGTIWWEGLDANADLEVILATLGNGLTAERDFDRATGRIRDIRVKNGPVPLLDHNYGFDDLGNLEFRLDQRREDFGYDGINQLTLATVTDSATQAVLHETTTQIGALGNIEFRPDVGWYDYDNIAAGPHAVTQAGGVKYSYDLNGNMTGSAFADTQAAIRSVEWSSFNKPTRVADALGLAASEFVYGPSRARVKHTVFDGAAVSKTITYIGAGFERRAPESGPAALVHFVRAGGTVVAEVTTVDDANPATDRTRYLHRDHLGSVALVTDEAGAIAEERAFGPWGQARNADWSVPASPPPLLETPRGFTGHEHLDAVGLIHMNGRVYDPKIGRFMSPDPSDATDPRVGYNRYAYVKNNPVSLVDPSGFEAGTPAQRGYDDDDEEANQIAPPSARDEENWNEDVWERYWDKRVENTLKGLRKFDEFVELEKKVGPYTIVVDHKTIQDPTSWYDYDNKVVHVVVDDLEDEYQTISPPGLESLDDKEYFEIMDNYPDWNRYSLERMIFHELAHDQMRIENPTWSDFFNDTEQVLTIEETNKFMYENFGEPYRNPRWR